jgi:hypothetical protein
VTCSLSQNGYGEKPMSKKSTLEYKKTYNNV